MIYSFIFFFYQCVTAAVFLTIAKCFCICVSVIVTSYVECDVLEDDLTYLK